MAHPELVPNIWIVDGQVSDDQVGKQQLLKHIRTDIPRAHLLVRAEDFEADAFQCRLDEIRIDLIKINPFLVTERHGYKNVISHLGLPRLNYSALLAHNFLPTHKTSVENTPPIDQDSLAGNKVAVRGREINKHSKEVFRRLQSLDRARLQLEFGKLFRRGLSFVLYQTGSNRVNADTELADFARERPRHSDERSFRRDVMQKERRACKGSRGGDIYDFSAALLFHLREDRFRAEKRTFDVDRRDPIPFFRRYFVKRLPLDVDEDRRVIDEDVDPTESLHGLGRHLDRILFFRNIDFERHRSTACRRDLLDDLIAVQHVRDDTRCVVTGRARDIAAGMTRRAAQIQTIDRRPVLAPSREWPVL